MRSAPEADIGRARAGSVTAAKKLLTGIAEKLRRGVSLEAAEAEFIADALEAAIGNYKETAKALCLVPGRGAPKRTGAARVAGHEVLALQGEGLPLEDGLATDEWDGVGALSTVAALWRNEYGISFTRNQLLRGLTAARKKRKRLVQARADAHLLLEQLMAERDAQ